MKNYEKPILSVMSFEVAEDIALKEYYYVAGEGDDAYNVSLFTLSDGSTSGT